ncbi:GGDEF domain-containing protein [Solimonas marina]|uniref:Diguanylate cyclase n=1 Tax=Solimonas marina TaxID=2714601 RepID=A0A969WC54_9GAMM|nr:GGDEF domain-containing protein [Solimonas marina]NKF22140.1 diguanylate cyclase [Solimonas marina]
MSLFSGTTNFLAHGYCLAWDPGLVFADVAANALIVLAYYSIPITLMVFIPRNPSLHFNWVFAMFSLFIFACGTGHLLDIVSIWIPVYRFDVSVRIVTAVASVATALMIWPILPKATAVLQFSSAARDSLRRMNEELQRSHDELARSHERFMLTLKNAPIGFAIVDLDGRFESVNPALYEMLGYTEAELLTKNFRDVTHPDDLPGAEAKALQLSRGEIDRYRLQKRYLHGSGDVVFVQLDVSMLRLPDGRPLHFIAQVQDIGGRIERERTLQWRATTDELTGLLNRRAFFDEAARVLSRVQRSGSPAVLLMIDVDRFKAINDTHGHAVGDRVLAAMKRFIEPRLRSGDLLARLGGEEFGVLLPDADVDAAQEIAERVRCAIAEADFETVVGCAVKLTASIGLAPVDGMSTIHQAVDRADQAMYRAKQLGRNRLIAV